MTARIVGFVTRAQAGLRAPKSVSHNITPSTGGVAVHYGGDGGPPTTHAGCIKRWKAWQDFHINGRGWVDIAYTMGFCNHGYAFAGRGAKVRTAAQGTNDGNQRFYGVVWIGGGSSQATPLATEALQWCIRQLRLAGAGNQVRAHRSFHSTACPGDFLARYAQSLDGAAINPPRITTPAKPSRDETRPSIPEARAPKYPLPSGSYFGPKSGPAQSVSGYFSHATDLRQWQVRMRQRGWTVNVDGHYTDQTAGVVEAFQAEKRLGVDGRIGPKTWAAAWSAPVTK